MGGGTNVNYPSSGKSDKARLGTAATKNQETNYSAWEAYHLFSLKQKC